MCTVKTCCTVNPKEVRYKKFQLNILLLAVHMKGIISSILCNSALSFQFQRICIQLPQSASGREDGGAGQVCPPPLRPGLSPLLSPLGTEPSQLYTIYNLSSQNNKDIYILNLLHFVRKILFSHSTRAQGNCFLYILYV